VTSAKTGRRQSTATLHCSACRRPRPAKHGGTPWPRPPDGDSYAAAAGPRIGAWGWASHANERQLASYEANAGAGDRTRARRACAAESILSCGPENNPVTVVLPGWPQVICWLSVLLHTGDPGGALQAASAAEDSWAAGGPRNPGTWAQVRTGTSIAHLLQDSLDTAVEQVNPVLALTLAGTWAAWGCPPATARLQLTG
jgi:hypothetical protein